MKSALLWTFVYVVVVYELNKSTEAAKIKREPINSLSIREVTDMGEAVTGVYDSATTAIEISRPSNDFQMEFLPLETRVRAYIDSVRRGQFTTMSNTSVFLLEINQYIAGLPKNHTTTVIKRERDSCYCEGSTRSPCPERCLYSCYKQYYGNYDDCRERHDSQPCYCTSDQRTRCGDMMKNCYTENVIIESAEECSEFSIDEKKLVKSFKLVLNLSMEPLQTYFRGVESRLTMLKQAATSVDHLSDIASLECQKKEDSMCTESRQILTAQKAQYREMRKNMTLELMKSTIQIDSVTRNTDSLKQQMYSQINLSLKHYACCLKNLNLTVENFDCPSKSIDPNHSQPVEQTVYS